MKIERTLEAVDVLVIENRGVGFYFQDSLVEIRFTCFINVFCVF